MFSHKSKPAPSSTYLRPTLAISVIAMLSACNISYSEDEAKAPEPAVESASTDYGYDTYGEDNLADSMASNDASTAAGSTQMASGKEGAAAIADSEERPTMQLQVVLDRAGFGPGVIDGEMGLSTKNALRGFQEANGITVTGSLDEATQTKLTKWEAIPATRVVTIPVSWSDATYTDIPEDTAEKAKLKSMGYTSLDEKLAERFHTTAQVLKMLNPDGRPAGMSGEGSPDTAKPSSSPSTDTAKAGASNQSLFRPGQQIRVPNIGADRIAPGRVDDRDWQRTLAMLGVGTEQPEADRVVVSKSGKTLKAYQGDKIVALFTVSSGSSEFPLPLGEWKILGEAFNPPYNYDPEVLGKNNADGETFTLPPGPNSPVGVIWIDLSKEHYGIHGTPDPETIGRAQSSGCVRLTNWDAARLSQMVSTQTKVIFEA